MLLWISGFILHFQHVSNMPRFARWGSRQVPKAAGGRLSSGAVDLFTKCKITKLTGMQEQGTSRTSGMTIKAWRQNNDPTKTQWGRELRGHKELELDCAACSTDLFSLEKCVQDYFHKEAKGGRKIWDQGQRVTIGKYSSGKSATTRILCFQVLKRKCVFFIYLFILFDYLYLSFPPFLPNRLGQKYFAWIEVFLFLKKCIYHPIQN